MPKRYHAALGLIAATFALGTFVAPASAQLSGPDQIRAQCIDEVARAHPGSSNDLQTMRVNLYSACMRRNGLQP
jgi:hypothetical protein